MNKKTSFNEATIQPDMQSAPDMPVPYREVGSMDELATLLEYDTVLEHYAFHDIDFNRCDTLATEVHYIDCLFMGCTIPANVHQRINMDTCLIFPQINVPFNCFRNELYNASSLYQGYCMGQPDSYAHSFDSIVYQHFLQMGKTATDIKETLARTLHDHAMSNAMHELLSHYEEKRVIGIMGGHGLLRTDAMFRHIAVISKRLTEEGYLMISGGGPGAMEATHFGAWMAGRTDEDVQQALQLLCEAPAFTHPCWLDTAFEVMHTYPQHEYISLGVPTWLYGHEPATPFATHIAKYFENAIREDGILTIAKGGIIYSPGSAGTMQEIFQDAVQNHYLSFGYASPMVFLGKDYWTREMPIYPLLQQLMQSGKYHNLILSLSDDEDEIIDALHRFSKEEESH